MSALARELEIERNLLLRKAKVSFCAFCFYVWPQFSTHWHIDLIAQAIDDIAEGRLFRLMLEMPPQFGKSTLLSNLAMAYLLGRRPNWRVFGASYAATLSTKLNRDVQGVMQSQAYRDVFPASALGGDVDKSANAPLRTQSAFEVPNARGYLRSVGTLGSATGFSADLICIDDAHKNADDAASPATRERVWSWFQTVMMTRLQKSGVLICLGTRWRTDDFLSRIREEASQEEAYPPWRVISLPAIAETERAPYDPRQPGEGLWDERFDVPTLLQRRRTIGERQFQALFQQNPVADELAIFKEKWLRWYKVLPGDLTDYTISADLTFDDRGDYTAMGVFARQGPNFYWVDLVEKRMDFTEQIETLERLARTYPQARVKLIEDAANGAALISALRKKIGGLIPVRQKTSKINRAIAASPVMEAGNFYMPRDAAWSDRASIQLTTFPAAANDDIVDCCTMFILWASQGQQHYTSLTKLSQPRLSKARWR